METVFSSAPLFSACALLLSYSFSSYSLFSFLFLSSHHCGCYVTWEKKYTACLFDAAYNGKSLLKIPLFCVRSCVEFNFNRKKNWHSVRFLLSPLLVPSIKHCGLFCNIFAHVHRKTECVLRILSMYTICLILRHACVTL